MAGRGFVSMWRHFGREIAVLWEMWQRRGEVNFTQNRVIFIYEWAVCLYLPSMHVNGSDRSVGQLNEMTLTWMFVMLVQQCAVQICSKIKAIGQSSRSHEEKSSATAETADRGWKVDLNLKLQIISNSHPKIHRRLPHLKLRPYGGIEMNVLLLLLLQYCNRVY